MSTDNLRCAEAAAFLRKLANKIEESL